MLNFEGKKPGDCQKPSKTFKNESKRPQKVSETCVKIRRLKKSHLEEFALIRFVKNCLGTKIHR